MTTKILLETKFGRIELVPTQAAHISVRPEEIERNQIPVTIRGVAHHFHAHVYRRKDGSFRIGQYESYGFNYETADDKAARHPDQWKRRQDNASALYMTRAGSIEDATKAARKALGEEVERVVNEWAKTDEARAALRSAEVTYRGEVVERAKAEWAKAKKAEAEAHATLEKALAARDELWPETAKSFASVIDAPYEPDDEAER